MYTLVLLLMLALVLAALAAVVGLLQGNRRAITDSCKSSSGKRKKSAGFVRIHPQWRSWLQEQRLTEPGEFLSLEATIVSGHTSRQVARVTLGEGAASKTLYLKREYAVRWITRLSNFLTGFGMSSRCVREASILDALERDGLPAPRWLATGEDGRGNAFLLVEEIPDTVGLAKALQTRTYQQRLELAAELGRTLACLHEAGFCHFDLYAKHVLVGPENSLWLLDWQRAWRGAWIPQQARIRDLAALHATLPEQLAGVRERLTLFRAYIGRALSLTRSSAKRHQQSRALLYQIDEQSRRMQNRRHIREKRQPLPSEPQNWIAVDGEALCITPALAQAMAGQSLDWLHLDKQPHPPGKTTLSRRWLPLAGNTVLLIRRYQPLKGYIRLWHWLRGQPVLSPEQRRATLLWRLERHGVAVPRLLAFGRKRTDVTRLDSFVLYQPASSTVRLFRWLQRAQRPARQQVLRQLGALMARLHEACCYLDRQGLDQLCVQLLPQTEGVAPGKVTPKVMLQDVDGVRAARRPQATSAQRDMARLRSRLNAIGCELADWAEVLQGFAEVPSITSQKIRRAVTSRASPIGTSKRSLEKDRNNSARAEMVGSDQQVPSLWIRLLYGWRRLRYRADWADHLQPGWPEQIMHMSVTDRFYAKQGRSTCRWRLPGVNAAGQPLVVYLKRHYVLPLWKGILATLWPGANWSPAMQEYEHLRWAAEQGVPVPTTVAAGEFIGPWFSLQSFLAVEELTGMLPLNEAIPLAAEQLPADRFRRWKRGLIQEMARLARLLHDRQHFHKDFYLCHFFIHSDDILAPGRDAASTWRGRVFLIDLHRLSHHRWTWWLWQLKDLAQLLYSSEVPGITIRDQMAFWIHYRGPEVGKRFSRWLRWLVLLKWRNYRRHNLRQQLHVRQQQPGASHAA